jgi:hypothetical protein
MGILYGIEQNILGSNFILEVIYHLYEESAYRKIYISRE